MTDHDALLAAILANRDDDTPRLAYADWCQENGQPERAEFIRAQVELARHQCEQRTGKGKRPGLVRYECPVCIELRRRERELWHQLPTDRIFTPPGFKIGVIDPYGPNFGFEAGEGMGGGCRVTRGFVSHVTCSWSDWRQHADAITARQPVERVRLTTRPEIGWVPIAAGMTGQWFFIVEDGIQRGEKVWVENEEDPYPLLLKATWPRIEFELPPAVRPDAEDMRDLMEQTLLNLGQHVLPGLVPDIR